MGKKILIVDDSSVMRKSIMFAVQQAGYETAEANNGREALDSIAESRPDLVICDVNMPVMDGISFLKTIKQDDAYALCRFIPVLMLTTESEKSMIEEGRKSGVRAWMNKPFDPDKLLTSVKMILG
jgi:two-component system, chemotaxis family, chemotaxis protein CheY